MERESTLNKPVKLCVDITDVAVAGLAALSAMDPSNRAFVGTDAFEEAFGNFYPVAKPLIDLAYMEQQTTGGTVRDLTRTGAEWWALVNLSKWVLRESAESKFSGLHWSKIRNVSNFFNDIDRAGHHYAQSLESIAEASMGFLKGKHQRRIAKAVEMTRSVVEPSLIQPYEQRTRALAAANRELEKSWKWDRNDYADPDWSAGRILHVRLAIYYPLVVPQWIARVEPIIDLIESFGQKS